ncbi:Lrp/AsnC family transcriptional regulator [Nesterenkonia aurantiaca]|uniref:Lrp/AsnC family transcriptional regulator n=1 Tax=Nesterenkonia aurantiaca TaxID=1436010 RepID=UPI003EE4BF76
MINAFVMMKTDPQRIPETAQLIANIDGVEAVYSMTGKWDLIAIVKTADFEQISELIPAKISKIAAVQKTETMIAFRSYSERDTGAAFSLGMS